jgi:hypothetical protein
VVSANGCARADVWAAIAADVAMQPSEREGRHDGRLGLGSCSRLGRLRGVLVAEQGWVMLGRWFVRWC